ncbi:MAG TPA: class I SAM-dependent methyltransferase [Vicinamibacterales bacterium]|nr:class I SAM-dependent methyltransferase [Vicinamibacterales bacterium]
MRLSGLRRHWNEYGRSDPLWAILTAPDKKGNRWSIEEFLQTGRDEIAQLMAYLDERRITVARGRALDFGCGAGRVTHALATHFDHAIGLDIAPSMVAKARELHGSLPNVEFRVNTSDRLESIESESIDLVYTRLVLQHMPPRYIRTYLAEFVRVLRPGGVAVFQLPGENARPVAARRGGLKGLLPAPVISMIRAVRDLRDFPRMELHGVPRAEVEQLMAGLGAPVVDTVDDRAHGADTPGYRYCAVKIAPPITAAKARPTSSM